MHRLANQQYSRTDHLKKGSSLSANRDSVCVILSATGTGHMMGRQTGDQSQLFYLFNLEERIPANHLLRRISPIVTRVLAPRAQAQTRRLALLRA